MDTVDEHYNGSIFSRLNPKFWSKAVSSNNKYDENGEFKYKFPFAWMANFLDAWHLAQMLMLIFIFLSGLSIYLGYKLDIWIMKIDITTDMCMDILIYTILFYIAWNGVFTLFYSWVWLKKK